jgi:DNA polymerase V
VVNLVDSPHAECALLQVEVEDVWGIGRRTAPRLRDHGIYTAQDLRESDEAWIKKQFGLPVLRTVLELRGTPCLTLESSPQPKQVITTSRSFGKPVETLGELKEAVADYVSRAAEKLRCESSVAKVVTVFLMTNPFNKDPQYHKSIAVKLPEPSDSTSELLRSAHVGLEKIFRQGFRYHKAGVLLTGILPKGLTQEDLFQKDPSRRRRSESLMRALDQVNARLGSGALVFAAEGTHKAWRMKSERRSQRYTTRWEELMEVSA